MAAAPTIGLHHITVVPTNYIPPSDDRNRRHGPSDSMPSEAIDERQIDDPEAEGS